ncbi:hypothetical protein AGMMS49942_13120 [Spirochaetia bacterium]|nr:hypothetical protein AGMMS49942_13120 [Spirochaetia bacterium]
MKNKLSDLNNHLFAEIERLGDEDLKGEKLTEEINRANAIQAVAGQIIANENLVLKAHVAKTDMVSGKLPLQLTD